MGLSRAKATRFRVAVWVETMRLGTHYRAVKCMRRETHVPPLLSPFRALLAVFSIIFSVLLGPIVSSHPDIRASHPHDNTSGITDRDQRRGRLRGEQGRKEPMNNDDGFEMTSDQSNSKSALTTSPPDHHSDTPAYSPSRCSSQVRPTHQDL